MSLTPLPAQQRQHLGRRQHHGQPWRALRPHDVFHPWQFLRQHLPVQKEQDRQHLIPCTRRHPIAARQIAEKAFRLRAAYFPRMTQAVRADMTANPVQAGPFGRQTAVFRLQSSANSVQLARPTCLRFGVAYDCKFAGILHRAVLLPDNTLNVSWPVAASLRRRSLLRVGKPN